LVKMADKNKSIITVAPNPIASTYQVRLTGFEKGTYLINVINPLGQIQYTKRIVINEFDHIEQMTRTGNMASGIYYLSVVDEKRSTVTKIGVVVTKE
jgi:hypothetical protein